MRGEMGEGEEESKHIGTKFTASRSKCLHWKDLYSRNQGKKYPADKVAAADSSYY